MCLQLKWHHLYSEYRDIDCTHVYCWSESKTRKMNSEGQLQDLLKLTETYTLSLHVVVTFLALLLFLFLFYF